MNVIKIEIEGIKRIKTSLDGIMYQSALAAITECYTLDGLNKRNLFSHNYGGWKSEMRCQHVWVLLRALFLDCDGYLLALCSHGLSLVCVHVCVCMCRESERQEERKREGETKGEIKLSAGSSYNDTNLNAPGSYPYDLIISPQPHLQIPSL